MGGKHTAYSIADNTEVSLVLMFHLMSHFVMPSHDVANFFFYVSFVFFYFIRNLTHWAIIFIAEQVYDI